MATFFIGFLIVVHSRFVCIHCGCTLLNQGAFSNEIGLINIVHLYVVQHNMFIVSTQKCEAPQRLYHIYVCSVSCICSTMFKCQDTIVSRDVTAWSLQGLSDRKNIFRHWLQCKIRCCKIWCCLSWKCDHMHLRLMDTLNSVSQPGFDSWGSIQLDK